MQVNVHFFIKADVQNGFQFEERPCLDSPLFVPECSHPLNGARVRNRQVTLTPPLMATY